jgi:hypothetical protein
MPAKTRIIFDARSAGFAPIELHRIRRYTKENDKLKGDDASMVDSFGFLFEKAFYLRFFILCPLLENENLRMGRDQ